MNCLICEKILQDEFADVCSVECMKQGYDHDQIKIKYMSFYNHLSKSEKRMFNFIIMKSNNGYYDKMKEWNKELSK